MKKSLLTLAVITVAGLSQAASLNWQIAGVKTAADSSVAGAEYTAMLFLTAQASTSGTAANPEWSNFGKANTTLAAVTELANAGKYDDLLALAAATGSTTSAGAISGPTGYNGNNFGAGDSLSGFALVVDKDKKNYFLTGTKDAAWTSGTGQKQLSFGNFATTAQYKSFGVPEPATGALALAGIALLFRRRK